jgi:DNA polymerase-3 subunit epsilon
MKPRLILLCDTETSSLEPADGHLLELGMLRWSVEHRTTIAQASWLVRAPGNPAEPHNGIPPAVLPEGQNQDVVLDAFRRWSGSVDAIVAHNGDFDQKWLPAVGKPWIDSAWDVDWPRVGNGRKLIDLALAHGLAVLDAHRALSDCLLLARLLERVAELGHDVGQLLARAMRPKVKVIAEVPFEQKDEAKAAGFRWEPYPVKKWWRMMPAEDIAALPFPTRVAT